MHLAFIAVLLIAQSTSTTEQRLAKDLQRYNTQMRIKIHVQKAPRHHNVPVPKVQRIPIPKARAIPHAKRQYKQSRPIERENYNDIRRRFGL
jgi:acetylornithine deacetylase/succinyl-diaminopimelate desuccinylase-like protein